MRRSLRLAELDVCLRVEVVEAVEEEVDHRAGPLRRRGSMVRAPAGLIRQGPVKQGLVRQWRLRIAGYLLRLSTILTARV
ncbi:hypothetical protein PIB30_069870 [Stylosanthes scabra]|uniref:Uncharacterized protein n=1 Tax=Stylosanthes scabra TaxID=79078 RepID=A0ABU6WLM4_9FABA|nr:hypothetical protein [Stylosanthes scabra]